VKRRCFLISTSVAPLGHPVTGGVSQMLAELAHILAEEWRITIIAPEGSVLKGFEVEEVAGAPHASSQDVNVRGQVIFPADSVLAAMLERAREEAGQDDLIINMAYDWLALYMTAFMPCRMLHYLSTAIISVGMKEIIAETGRRFPLRLAVLSRAQARLYGEDLPFFFLTKGVDVEAYPFNPAPRAGLIGWAGRISPEKGLEKAMAVAAELKRPLRVMGEPVNPEYWQECRRAYPQVAVEATGHLPMPAFARALSECELLLMAPQWVEAFGVVAAEAGACGVPVVCFDDSGTADVVVDGVTGFAVKRGNDAALLKAVRDATKLDRAACRRHIEKNHSRAAVAQSVRKWLRAAA
jgi:UDP-glucose:tetrahydrobiopterin glucosyltransferase